MQRPLLGRLSLVVLATAALAGGAAGAARGDQTVRLTGDTVRNLTLATPTGHVDASRPVTVGVTLKNPNQAAEDAYVASLYDPASSTYRQFLDPAAFRARFGVPAATRAAAESWLHAQGLTTTEIEGATDYVLATGSAAKVQSAFATTLNTYSYNGRTLYANTTAPAVPASLGI